MKHNFTPGQLIELKSLLEDYFELEEVTQCKADHPAYGDYKQVLAEMAELLGMPHADGPKLAEAAEVALLDWKE